MATSYGMFVCYDAQTGEKYWEQEAESSIYASPVVAEGRVYMIDKEGNTYIYEVASEYKLIGTPALGEKVVCTPAFADGTVYIRGYEHVYSIGK
jgi:outer membrane protein assembly factor BamB